MPAILTAILGDSDIFGDPAEPAAIDNLDLYVRLEPGESS